MCSAHIFKVIYMYLYAIIRGTLIFFTDACSFPNRWFAGAPLHSGAKFLYYGIYVLFGFAYNFIRRLIKRVEFSRLSIIRLKSYPA